MLSVGVCENRDGWLVAWGLCGCMLIRFSAVWLLPFTLFVTTRACTCLYAPVRMLKLTLLNVTAMATASPQDYVIQSAS